MKLADFKHMLDSTNISYVEERDTNSPYLQIRFRSKQNEPVYSHDVEHHWIAFYFDDQGELTEIHTGTIDL